MSDIDNETDALARLDELRAQRLEAQRAERDILDEIKAVLRTASTVLVDGEPISRSTLIAHSGLSRRTAYQILDTLPAERQEP